MDAGQQHADQELYPAGPPERHVVLLHHPLQATGQGQTRPEPDVPHPAEQQARDREPDRGQRLHPAHDGPGATAPDIHDPDLEVWQHQEAVQAVQIQHQQRLQGRRERNPDGRYERLIVTIAIPGLCQWAPPTGLDYF